MWGGMMDGFFFLLLLLMGVRYLVQSRTKGVDRSKARKNVWWHLGLGKWGVRGKGKQKRDHQCQLEDCVWRGPASTSSADSLEVGVNVLFSAVTWKTRCTNDIKIPLW